MPREDEHKHIVVTGTSGAVGAALARELRRKWPDARLTLVDLNESLSRTLAADLGGEVDVEPFDLAQTDCIPALIERARGRFGPVFGLVNCAGFMEVRGFERLPWSRAEALLSVDLISPLRLMHALVPDMLAAGRGFVVNVASMAGKVTLPGCAFYCAAKGGLAMASEIAHRELRSRGVDVLTVYPGPVRSALEARARDQYGRTLMTRMLPTGEPDVLARRITASLLSRRPRVIYPAAYVFGLTAWASPLALAVGPRALD